MKVGEAQQMEEGLRRELARVGRDIEVAIIIIVIIAIIINRDIEMIILLILTLRNLSNHSK